MLGIGAQAPRFALRATHPTVDQAYIESTIMAWAGDHSGRLYGTHDAAAWHQARISDQLARLAEGDPAPWSWLLAVQVTIVEV